MHYNVQFYYNENKSCMRECLITSSNQSVNIQQGWWWNEIFWKSKVPMKQKSLNQWVQDIIQISKGDIAKPLIQFEFENWHWKVLFKRKHFLKNHSLMVNKTNLFWQHNSKILNNKVINERRSRQFKVNENCPLNRKYLHQCIMHRV